MEYLRRTDLETFVSKALVDTVNRREEKPLRAMAEHLLRKAAALDGGGGGGGGGGSGGMISSRDLQDEVSKREKAEAEVRQLRAEGKQREDEAARFEAENEELKKDNASLHKHVAELRAHSEKLERWLRELDPTSGGKTHAIADELPAAGAGAGSISASASASVAAAARAFDASAGRLFDELDATRVGTVATTSIHGLARALQTGCDNSPDPAEAAAMRAFLGVVQGMESEHPAYSREEWVAYRPADAKVAAFFTSAEQMETVAGVLTAILGEPAAKHGLLAAVQSHAASLRSLSSIMGRLYDFCLCQGTPKRLRAFIDTLRAGCDNSPDPREREGMRAFLRMLERMADAQSTYSRAEWVGYQPPADSFTKAETEAYLDMLTSILENQEAVRGVKFMIDDKAPV